MAMMVDFVVGARVPGTMDTDAAAWLTPYLAGQRATKTMGRIARELAAEADEDGTALPSSPEGYLMDRASAQVVVKEMLLAA